jgi:hypothetical protein
MEGGNKNTCRYVDSLPPPHYYRVGPQGHSSGSSLHPSTKVLAEDWTDLGTPPEMGFSQHPFPHGPIHFRVSLMKENSFLKIYKYDSH